MQMMTVAAMMMMMRTILNAQEKQRRSESHFLRFRKGAKYPQTESEGKTGGVIESHFLLSSFPEEYVEYFPVCELGLANRPPLSEDKTRARSAALLKRRR